MSGSCDPRAAKQQLLEFACRHDAERSRRRSPVLTGVVVGAGVVAALRLLSAGRRGPGLLNAAVRAVALARLAAPLVPIVAARLRARSPRPPGPTSNGIRSRRQIPPPPPIPAP